MTCHSCTVVEGLNDRQCEKQASMRLEPGMVLRPVIPAG